MNHPFRQRLLLGLGLLLAAGAPPAGRAAPAAPTRAALQSQHIKESIDALFKHRLKPDPLPVTLPNPFLVVSGVISNKRPDGSESDPASVGDSEAHDGPPAAKPGDAPPPGSDAEALARHVASLKIGGTIQINGQLQLIINQSPRKEGDLIFLDNKSAVIYLRLIRLTPTELTLGFNEAVQTVRLKY
jgi:hypothetical protein